MLKLEPSKTTQIDLKSLTGNGGDARITLKGIDFSRTQDRGSFQYDVRPKPPIARRTLSGWLHFESRTSVSCSFHKQ